MPVVRVNVAQAEHLESEYDRAANTIDATIDDLSAMLAEANWLLEQRSSPLYGPLPSLTETATGLHNDRDDLAWRVDHLQQTDAMFLRGLDMLSGYTPNLMPDGYLDNDYNENLAAFRQAEARAHAQRTPLENAEHSLSQIRTILDTAKHDRGRGIGATVADDIWSTEDLDAIIENEHGYYTATQVRHAQTVADMANSSPEAREHLGITESGNGWTLDDIGHLTLDILGLVPFVGNAADGINATWYAAQGRYLDAALSSIALIPGLGQLVAPMRHTIRAAAGTRAFRSLDEALQWARRWLDDAGVLRQADEAAAAARNGDIGRGIQYDEFGSAVSVDARTLFGPTNTTNNPLLNDVGLQDDMAEAWMDSADLFTPREHGGWIVQNADGTHSAQRWPAGDQARIGPPQDVPDNVVGAFHTHPNVRGIPEPSDADVRMIQGRPELAPHYVVSHEGLYAIDASGNWTTLG